MKSLGVTYGEVLAANCFGVEEVETLRSFIMNSLGIGVESVETLIASPTAYGELMTGNFFLVEDDADIDKMIADTHCSDIRDSLAPSDILFDTALYLNSRESVALLMMCTRDSGGDVYIIPEELIDAYPSVHEHVFEANQ